MEPAEIPMQANDVRRLGFALTLAGLAVGCSPAAQLTAADADQIRVVERERLRMLVDADIEGARRLHSDDFQLITPAGDSLTREEYLGALGSGDLDYRAWEAGDIRVRLHGDAAVVRYRDRRFEVYFGDRRVHSGPMYHTNLYERREGRWVAVWSQASGVITP